MKFIELRLNNFKPYYNQPGKPVPVRFFDHENRSRKTTLNIGPTGHGKTSLSDAILWCLYGEVFESSWENWINEYYYATGKDLKQKDLSFSVELTIELDGERYRIVRTGNIALPSGKKTGNSDISVIKDGDPIDATSFIGRNFPTLALMRYFVFDVDDIFKKFEENQQKTIRDHINKFAGIETLDLTIESLEKVSNIFQQKIEEIERDIPGDLNAALIRQQDDIKGKERAKRTLVEEISRLKGQKEETLKNPPTEIKVFTSAIKERDKLNKDIKELNDNFLNSEIAKDMDLVLLYLIYPKIKKSITDRGVTKTGFEASASQIRYAIGSSYKGIIFSEENQTFLIKSKTKIDQKSLEKTDNLDFEANSSGRPDSHIIAADLDEKVQDVHNRFLEFKTNIDKMRGELVKINARIDRIGNTEKNKELSKKYQAVLKIEEEIDKKEKLGKEIDSAIQTMNGNVERLRDQILLSEDQKTRISEITKKKVFTEKILEIAKETRETFLKDLLEFVNKEASEMMRNIVGQESYRWHKIEIDTDYHFKVKRKNGEILDLATNANRGHLQIAIMCFFFSLSKYLDKKIPYVLDNPLIRLDPVHDYRLMDELKKTNEQLILHLIPGKEYTNDSYRWLAPDINVQNWISRRKVNNDRISYVEEKDAHKMIKFSPTDLEV